MFQIKAKIIKNQRVKDNYFHSILYAPCIAKSASPGQFVNIRVSDTFEPLLRRPLSIHRALGFRPQASGQIEILYEVLGRGTQILSQRKVGEYLDLIGPLGNGFEYRRPSPSGRLRSAPLSSVVRHSILIAGGIGVAPLFFLAKKLTEYGIRNTEYERPLVLLGAKIKSQILCEKEFQKLGCSVKIATDDGSRGFKGKVTDLLKSILRNNASNAITQVTLYACGPRSMLKEISVLSREYNIPAQVSLEEYMACGIGVCLGCVVKVRSEESFACKQAKEARSKFEYKRVCKEGPVFAAQEIIWSGHS